MIVDNDLSLKSIQHYGAANQLFKAIEELLELAIELSCSIEGAVLQTEYKLTLIRKELGEALELIRKASDADYTLYQDQTDEDWICMLHEVADVAIVLKHAANVSGHGDEVQDIIRKKEARLVNRIMKEAIA